MDTKRLSQISDVCPLPVHPTWLYATQWMSSIADSIAPVIFEKNQYTTTVISNSFFCWHRIFTRDNKEPIIPKTKAFFHLIEWCPTTWPTSTLGWKHLGVQHCEAIAYVNEENFSAAWSSHARRHLRDCKKSNVTFRFGTFDEFKKNISASQIPKRLHNVFIDEVSKHINAHASSVEIIVAETPEKKFAGCFVAGNIEETKQSYYISGYFVREFEKLQVMTGLIHRWFELSYARKFTTLNFGHIVTPKPNRFLKSGIGYSIFKTHFGVQRVWWPGNFWRLSK